VELIASRMRRALASALVVTGLALPGGALAAPIPGAHYTGTTDQNFPISFDVAPDGASLTNVVTTVNGFCIGGPGGLLQYSTNSPFAFPIAGDTISGDDPDTFPYLKMRGSFTSPQEASGTLSAYNGGFQNGTPYYCNALDRAWSASTSSTGGGGGDNGGGGGGGDNGGGGGGGDNGGGSGAGGGPPTITLNLPSGIKLKQSLANGLILAIDVDQASTLTVKLILSAKNAKKYGLGKKAVTVSKASAKNAGPGTALEFTFKKAIRKALKKAKKVKFIVEVTAVGADGSKGTGSGTLTLG
jgi:hypothetical protein